MNPLDLPGPVFLLLYLGLGAVAFVVTLVLRYLARGRRGEPSEALLGGMDPYRIAYLRGGADAAVQAAVAALIHRGRLALENAVLMIPEGAEPERELVADGVYRGISAPKPDHPLELAVLRSVAPHATLATVQASATGAADELAQSLEGLGLIRSRRSLIGRNLVVRAPLMGVVALGAAKLAVGIARDRPVGFLVVLLLVTLVVAWLVAVKPGRTPLGDRVLAVLKERNDALRITAGHAPQQLTDRDVALASGIFGAIALGGGLGLVNVLWPTTVSASSALLARSSRSGGSTGSSCGTGCGSSWSSSCASSCSSSCGGSSCGGGCGGGCGGCGG